jgi:hypothetical protein
LYKNENDHWKMFVIVGSGYAADSVNRIEISVLNYLYKNENDHWKMFEIVEWKSQCTKLIV